MDDENPYRTPRHTCTCEPTTDWTAGDYAIGMLILVILLAGLLNGVGTTIVYVCDWLGFEGM